MIYGAHTVFDKFRNFCIITYFVRFQDESTLTVRSPIYVFYLFITQYTTIHGVFLFFLLPLMIPPKRNPPFPSIKFIPSLPSGTPFSLWTYLLKSSTHSLSTPTDPKVRLPCRSRESRTHTFSSFWLLRLHPTNSLSIIFYFLGPVHLGTFGDLPERKWEFYPRSPTKFTSSLY